MYSSHNIADQGVTYGAASNLLTLSTWNPEEEELYLNEGSLAVKKNSTRKISNFVQGQEIAVFFAQHLDRLNLDLRLSKNFILENYADPRNGVGTMRSAAESLEIVLQLWKKCEPNLKVIQQRLEQSETEVNRVTAYLTKLSGGSKRIADKMEEIRRNGLPESVSFTTKFIDSSFTNNLLAETVITENQNTKHRIINFYNVKVENSHANKNYSRYDDKTPSSCVGKLRFTFTKGEGVVLGTDKEVITEKADGTSTERLRIYFNGYHHFFNSLDKDFCKQVLTDIISETKPSFITYDKRDAELIKEKARESRGYKNSILEKIAASK